jgi:hypothetical protein
MSRTRNFVDSAIVQLVMEPSALMRKCRIWSLAPATNSRPAATIDMVDAGVVNFNKFAELAMLAFSSAGQVSNQHGGRC